MANFLVRIAANTAPLIEAWRDRFVSSVGIAKYRRAAGWALDETAKAAVGEINKAFDRTMKSRTPFTKAAVKYTRSGKGGLDTIEAGGDGVFASVWVPPDQSAYLRYGFGEHDNVRLPGDVGLAQDRILLPFWDNIRLTQGVSPTASGGVPSGFLARLNRGIAGTRAAKKSNTCSRWGVYKGTINIHGEPRLTYIARPPCKRVEVDEYGGASAMIYSKKRGFMVRVGHRMENTDTPRVLFLAVNRATYQPSVEQPWQDACAAAAARIPDIMAAQLADNIAHQAAKA